MWPRDGCLNQRSFCFYAEMWALGSARLCSTAFVSVPTSLPLPFLFFFGISIFFFSFSCLTLLSFNTLSLLNFFPLLLPLPCCSAYWLISTFPFFLSLPVILIHAFLFSHTSLNLTSSPPPCPSPKTPLPAYCLPPSVPAGGRGPLGAATAAQGQLHAGRDEAGQHPERMPRGDLHLRGGPRGFRERREDGKGMRDTSHRIYNSSSPEDKKTPQKSRKVEHIKTPATHCVRLHVCTPINCLKA